MKNKLKLYLKIFLVFSKIGVMAFGGGYAILPILNREIVEKQKWVTKKQLSDYFAIAQCLPGIIASNVAVFIGSKVGKKTGGIVASLGVVFPSFLIISMVAGVLTQFYHVQAVEDAFIAVRACVCALIVKAIIELWKTSIVDKKTFILFLITVAGAIALPVSPVIFVCFAGISGILITYLGLRRHK